MKLKDFKALKPGDLFTCRFYEGDVYQVTSSAQRGGLSHFLLAQQIFPPSRWASPQPFSGHSILDPYVRPINSLYD